LVVKEKSKKPIREDNLHNKLFFLVDKNTILKKYHKMDKYIFE